MSSVTDLEPVSVTYWDLEVVTGGAAGGTSGTLGILQWEPSSSSWFYRVSVPELEEQQGEQVGLREDCTPPLHSYMNNIRHTH
ncbi:hypothetical protein INR49_023821 [Caranx melampygus]|nr:hypothetical protein INR49_023821 [Caranx melampygus]